MGLTARKPQFVLQANTNQCDPHIYTTLTNFSTKYLVMCKVYTVVGGIN